jgi:hypothetical protein
MKDLKNVLFILPYSWIERIVGTVWGMKRIFGPAFLPEFHKKGLSVTKNKRFLNYFQQCRLMPTYVK